MKKLLILYLTMVLSVLVAQAQTVIKFDRITLRTKKVIEAKVTEVGTEEIRYKFSNDADAAIYSIKKTEVLKIDFADGRTDKFAGMEKPDLYSNQKRMAVKLDIVGPLFGHTSFSFERSIKPGMSWETTLGFIGLGNDSRHEAPKGINFKAGVRFYKVPNCKKGIFHNWQMLAGAYLKPEIIFGAYNTTQHLEGLDYTTFNYESYKYDLWKKVNYGAFNLVCGEQIVISDLFIIDLYAGLGFGFVRTTTTTTNPYPKNTFGPDYGYVANQYGTFISQDLPLSASAGIKLGFLIK